MDGQNPGLASRDIAAAATVADLGRLLRQLRRREARQRGDTEWTYRELAARTGWSLGSIGKYLDGKALPPTDRFDTLIRLLGATPTEQGDLASARDRVEEYRRASFGGTGAVLPRQLPADVTAFTGRADQLTTLDSLLTPGTRVSTVVVSALSGTAGVGKTALALHWAHRVASRFPDGQLYVDLRGFDPDQPLTAGDALAMFLRALGIASAEIPYETEERAARYRTALAGRRTLVVLDNAHSVEQIRLLLPGGASCRVVVTSRDSLAALVARHGAERIDLDLLPLADAVALLKALVGARVDAEPEAATTLAGQCARLPLALRVAAELVAARPATSLAELVSELADQQHRLDLMDAGSDPRTGIRAVFSWSYQQLPAAAARAFRLLGWQPLAELDVWGAAALHGTTISLTQQTLDLLTRAHLIHVHNDRFGMHDLLRAYADRSTAAEDSEQHRQAGLTRLFDYYLAATAAAMDILHPAERHRRPGVTPTSLVPPVGDPSAAQAWLDAERSNLVMVCAHAATHDRPAHAIRLAATLFRYLDINGHYPDALAIHTHARRAACLLGDRPGEAHALCHLGGVHWRQGRYPQAAEHYEQALSLFCDADDLAGQARAWYNLGLVHERQGRYALAAEHDNRAVGCYRDIGDRAGAADAQTNLGVVQWRQGDYGGAAGQLEQALGLYRDIGDRGGEAYASNNLGLVHLRQGRYAVAVHYHQHALAVYRETGNRSGEAYALTNLGLVHERLGDLTQAAGNLLQALTFFRETGNRTGEAHCLNDLALLRCREHNHQQAIDYQQQAIAQFREIGDHGGQAEALNTAGEIFYERAQPQHSHAQHRAALGIAIELGDRYQQARAHHGLGHAQHALGEHDSARQQWTLALALFTDLDVPEADHVRASITSITDAADRPSVPQ